MRTFMMFWTLALGFGWGSVVSGQGFLLSERDEHAFRMPRPPMPHPQPRPTPPQSYKVKELSVNATVTDQLAKVQVSQTFVNTGSTQLEVAFVFPLPYDGAVERLTYMVDGKEFEAKLLDAAEARRIYESYIRRNQDPALLEWIGSSLFRTSVFPVPPGAERTVSLRYSQVCRKSNGLTEILFPLSAAKFTSQPLEKLSFQISLQSQAPIKNIYSPSHAIEIRRPSDKQAVVSFSKTNEVPLADWRLFYDVGQGGVMANVLSYRPDANDEGYFLMLVSPEIKAAQDIAVKKSVVFVVDRSGSMSGKKIEQAKSALKFVLNNLREGDLFNVVAYDTVVESFRPELQRYNDETRVAALGFVEGIYAGGSTNIDGALNAALTQLADDSRANYIVFLTDGLPTAGVTQEGQIVSNAQQRNRVHARVFSFGVGYDVNSRLLDKLSRACFGQSEYVRPNDDIEAYVSKLHNRIGAPAMTNVSFLVDVEGLAAEQGAAVNRVYPRNAYDLFAGDQLVLVGRYKKPGAAKVTVKGSVDKNEQSFHFPATLVEKSADESFAFIEKLWAMRRVGEIIDEIDLQGKNKELVDELVALSKKHGILTPYTSFLAEERVDLHNRTALRSNADAQLDGLAAGGGIGGFSQRASKLELQKSIQAPTASGSMRYRETAGDREVEVRTIQSVGRKTFFLKNNRWTDSAIDQDQEKKAQKIERFSPEYFQLITQHGKDVSKYLALEGEVLLELGGQVYAF